MAVSKIKYGFMLLLLALPAFAQNDQSLILHGNELYKKGAYDKAAEDYRKAAEANKANAKAQYNLGNALYKNKQLDEAAKAFAAAGEAASEKSLMANSKYNKGVSHSRQNQLVESIGEYKSALKINPTDQQARENLQRALNELKKQNENQDQNKNKDKNQEKDPEKQEPKPEKSKLNEKQAERMMNALRQEEKRLQQNKQNKEPSSRMQEKDW